MSAMVELLREGFSPFLAAGVMFSAASVWAAVKGLRMPSEARQETRKPPR